MSSSSVYAFIFPSRRRFCSSFDPDRANPQLLCSTMARVISLEMLDMSWCSKHLLYWRPTNAIIFYTSVSYFKSRHFWFLSPNANLSLFVVFVRYVPFNCSSASINSSWSQSWNWWRIRRWYSGWVLVWVICIGALLIYRNDKLRFCNMLRRTWKGCCWLTDSDEPLVTHSFSRSALIDFDLSYRTWFTQ